MHNHTTLFFQNPLQHPVQELCFCILLTEPGHVLLRLSLILIIWEVSKSILVNIGSPRKHIIQFNTLLCVAVVVKYAVKSKERKKKCFSLKNTFFNVKLVNGLHFLFVRFLHKHTNQMVYRLRKMIIIYNCPWENHSFSKFNRINS